MEMSRLRNRHCLPFLKAGKIFLRANSSTVSGLRSRITATCLLFNSSSSLSNINTSRRMIFSCPSAKSFSLEKDRLWKFFSDGGAQLFELVHQIDPKRVAIFGIPSETVGKLDQAFEVFFFGFA